MSKRSKRVCDTCHESVWALARYGKKQLCMQCLALAMVLREKRCEMCYRESSSLVKYRWLGKLCCECVLTAMTVDNDSQAYADRVANPPKRSTAEIAKDYPDLYIGSDSYKKRETFYRAIEEKWDQGIKPSVAWNKAKQDWEVK